MAHILSAHIKISIDEDWYLATFPQAKREIEAGLYSDAIEHYLRVGMRQLPLEPVVNEKFYLERYPDVSQAINEGKVESAEQHYMACGYREGRDPVGVGDYFSFRPKRRRPLSLFRRLRFAPVAPRQLAGNGDAESPAVV